MIQNLSERIRALALQFAGRNRKITEPEDLVQQVSTKAVADVKDGKVYVGGDAQLSSLIRERTLNAARHQARDAVRDDERHARFRDHVPARLPDNMDPWEHAVAADLGGALTAALDRLPLTQRVAFLRKHEGFKFWETAKELGVRPQTVKNAYRRAVEALKVALAAYQPGVQP